MFQRSQWRVIVLCSLFRASAVEAFLATRNQPWPRDWNYRISFTATICFSIAIPRESSMSMVDKSGPSTSLPNSRIEFVDFWGTKVSTNVDDQLSVGLPTDPYLDRYEGPLPPGAYQIYGNSDFDPKPNCRIVLSLDWHQNHSRFQRAPLHADQVVRQIQSCLDAGFQSFQLSPESRRSHNGMEMVGRVVRETPKCVDMHWTACLELPRLISPVSVREGVIELLSTMRMDSLDTILVPYDLDILPQYHFEVMDVLHDMQRDGYIRSIGVENWPASLVKQAQEYGFHIHVHQQSGNLLLPPSPFSMKVGEKASATTHCWINPLADNFLTENVALSPNPPVHAKGWKDIKTWHTRKHQNKENRRKESMTSSASDFDVWKIFKKEVHETLSLISSKHEVSIAAIALRWCLQEKEPKDRNLSASSIVYPLSLVEEPEGQLSEQLRKLRDVFRFELDVEDMAILDSLVARPIPKATTIRIDDVDVSIAEIPVEYLKDFEALSAAQNKYEFRDSDAEMGVDYPDIDFNNPKLWL